MPKAFFWSFVFLYSFTAICGEHKKIDREDYNCRTAESNISLSLVKIEEQYFWSYFVGGDGEDFGPFLDRLSAYRDMAAKCVDSMGGCLTPSDLPNSGQVPLKTTFCRGIDSSLSVLDRQTVCPNHHPVLSRSDLDPEVRKNLESRIPPDEIVKCLEEVQLPYINFQGQQVAGRMILNSDIALETKCMFNDLQNIKDATGEKVGYRIAAIKTADDAEYFWQRDSLMEANITWGYNARELRNFRTMGRALSLNPLCNPEVRHKAGGGFDFKTMRPKNSDPSKLFDDPSCFLGGYVGNKAGQPSSGIAAKVRALFRGSPTHFAKYEGWEWGGDWNDEKGFGRIQKRGLNQAVENPGDHPGPHRTKGPYCKVTALERKALYRDEIAFLLKKRPSEYEYKKFCGKFRAKPKNQAGM